MSGELSPKKYWYTVEELACKWNTTPSDILHRIECNGILPSFRVSSRYYLWQKDDLWNFTQLGDDTGAITDVLTVLFVNRSFTYNLIKGRADLFEKFLFNPNLPDILYRLIESVEVSLSDVLITIDEVIRFELRHSIPATVPTVQVGSDTAAEPQRETDDQSCERLKAEGWNKVDIAHELKRAFPSITHSRIGRLITAVPGVDVETGAYSKRVIRLLKKLPTG
jgi:hypothetical protein